MTTQKQILISLFKSGKLQELVTKQTLKALPKEIRQQFKKEGIPDEVKAEIENEINKQLSIAGISQEELNG